MSRIRGKDTKPELAVRRALWAAGLRYRLHDKRLPGHPDLVFPARRAVVFVHGCFWHCHEGCANFRIPKTRDTEVRAALEMAGWRVIVIWECEVANGVRLDAVVNEIRAISRQERHTERN